MLKFPLPLSSDPVFPSALRAPHSALDDALVDGFGRVHDNLRVSVTDRCNLRCTYCMPEEVEFLPRSEVLSFEEVAAFVRVAAGLGVTKVRLTGGEPLLRRDLPALVRMVAAVPGIRDIGLTTNGLLLEKLAGPLFEAGLRRLNVSLDTLDPGRFRELARRDGLDRVLAGLAAAKRVGFVPVKVNAVAIRGFVEQDAVPLARYCRAMGFELRFIESMPIGAGEWERAAVVTAAEIRSLIEEGVAPFAAGATGGKHDPAETFAYADGGGRVGFIASVSRPFCDACNRLRLTADGKLRNCLFATGETDVRPWLRPVNEAALAAALRTSVGAKAAGHGFNGPAFVKPDRTMHAIGG